MTAATVATNLLMCIRGCSLYQHTCGEESLGFLKHSDLGSSQVWRASVHSLPFVFSLSLHLYRVFIEMTTQGVVTVTSTFLIFLMVTPAAK